MSQDRPHYIYIIGFVHDLLVIISCSKEGSFVYQMELLRLNKETVHRTVVLDELGTVRSVGQLKFR
jgi:hypothetical protein